jgi:hypothetical protein
MHVAIGLIQINISKIGELQKTDPRQLKENADNKPNGLLNQLQYNPKEQAKHPSRGGLVRRIRPLKFINQPQPQSKEKLNISVKPGLINKRRTLVERKAKKSKFWIYGLQ